MTKVAIIGANGFVGTAMSKLFPNAIRYDTAPGFVASGVCASQVCVNGCQTAFIAVPTPCCHEGALDTSIVESVVAWLECPLIIIRSTLNPGTVDYLEKKYRRNIAVVPEYIGESVAHPLLDEKARPFLIVGGRPEVRRSTIELFQTVYNAHVTIRQMSAYAAEVTKLSENRSISFKVAQCQELWDACENAGVDYYEVRESVYGDDVRQNLWFSFVYPDRRGMNSSCIPKDVYAWAAWAESVGASASITRAILERNKKWLELNEQGES